MVYLVIRNTTFILQVLFLLKLFPTTRPFSFIIGKFFHQYEELALSISAMASTSGFYVLVALVIYVCIYCTCPYITVTVVIRVLYF